MELNHLEIQVNDPQINSTPIGYAISDTNEEVKKALQVACDLVREARQAGVETRHWASKASEQTKDLLVKTETLASPMSTKNSSELEKILWELTGWENRILQVLRSYINEMADSMKNLKLLNPPLNSLDLKPFIEAMASDRKITLASLEPLTANIEKLASLKSQLRNNIPSPAGSGDFISQHGF